MLSLMIQYNNSELFFINLLKIIYLQINLFTFYCLLFTVHFFKAMSIEENLQTIRSSLPQGVKLVVVSKTRTNEEVMEAYDAGQRVFGENKVQELLRKQKQLPRDIEWHLIGHLQGNKVKSVVPIASVIQSVDSFRILKAIDREAFFSDKVTQCLLQIHIASEETKFGFSFHEVTAVLKSPDYSALKNIAVTGVMGMATFTDNSGQVRQEFRNLRNIFDELKQNFFKEDDHFKEISMGMSDDYQIAIEEGSTIIRIGSKIFGPRTSASDSE
jgi:PLP dependent protein